MWRWFKWVTLGIGVLGTLFLYVMFPPSFYLSHQKPVLILPFDQKYDSMSGGLLPMGEKAVHKDAPDGHPGIDFGLTNITGDIPPYIASMDGTVTRIRYYDNPDMGKKAGEKTPLSPKEVDVTITKSPYQTVYGEMDAATLPSNIKKGAKIKQGDIVGYGNLSTDPSNTGAKIEMIHWEFGSPSPIIDRFCPLTYFTADSLARINNIWAKDTSDIKKQYPKICNSGYDGKAEK